ncbi:putative toxin-antitoxin system toxin component, PIN family [Planktothrix sp. FACHB-1365]|uniref:putative toxin-antitoxin system toxin component, PIN family n=1 Tax=Planktothrix sp. FACHB-1365 TaxID=2692855 RepID=UPI00168874A6|nr:putative toxin-antitoxin system toxin component, PIN family [Planktothrix sp. FACHB-1365]MBD2482242.1 putative toxin-antitoxin system toxin component, PIN family [Planktothrix sp. FACHB-1365]
MRIILDTNTVISGLFWRGKPFQVLELMRLGRIKVYTSGAILEELLDVLNRPKFSTRLALLGFSPQEVVNSLMSWVEVVEIGEVEKIVISDPDDDQIIACAKLVDADFIISGDTDLLNIREKITIPIVSAGEFLDILADSTS